MDIFTVQCPGCHKEFYADMLLYSLKVELHCPFCEDYFRKEDSPKLVTGASGASPVAKIAGGLTRDMLFRPEPEDD